MTKQTLFIERVKHLPSFLLLMLFEVVDRELRKRGNR
jgi:hypothetical protein